MLKKFCLLIQCFLPIIAYAGNFDGLRLDGACSSKITNSTQSEIDYSYTCSLPLTTYQLRASALSSNQRYFVIPGDEVLLELIVTGSWKVFSDSIRDIENNAPQLHVYYPFPITPVPAEMKQQVSCNQDASECVIHLQTGVIFTNVDDGDKFTLPATDIITEKLYNIIFPLDYFKGVFFWD